MNLTSQWLRLSTTWLLKRQLSLWVDIYWVVDPQHVAFIRHGALSEFQALWESKSQLQKTLSDASKQGQANCVLEFTASFLHHCSGPWQLESAKPNACSSSNVSKGILGAPLCPFLALAENSSYVLSPRGIPAQLAFCSVDRSLQLAFEILGSFRDRTFSGAALKSLPRGSNMVEKGGEAA